MTYDEFRRQLAIAGLSIQELADLLNKPRAALTNYAAGGRVPDHIAVIVVLMAALREARVDFAPLVRGLGIERKKARGAAFPRRAAGDGDLPES